MGASMLTGGGPGADPTLGSLSGGAIGQMDANFGRGIAGGIPINLAGTPLGTLTGSAGGAGGTGFARPTGANIQAPVTQGQVDQSNAGVGGSLASQNALIAALGGQGAIGRQTDIGGQTGQLAGQLGGVGGVGIQNSAAAQQHGLNMGLGSLNAPGQLGGAAGLQAALNAQLGSANGVGAQATGFNNLAAALQGQQAVAAGQGPNPAQAMLNQSTGQNIANQAALMAGQRGAGANVGLMARQAAQQGAATQQQAAGQAATLQSQQQLNALNAQGALAGQQAAIGAGLTGQQQAGIGQQYGQGAGIAGLQQSGIGQEFGQGSGLTGQQLQALGLGAGIAQSQVGNQMGAQATGLQGNIANAGQQIGAAGAYNTNLVNMQGNINNANTSLANTGMQGQQAMIGGILSGAGAGSATALGARGGAVHRMADGGDTAPYPAPQGQGPLMPAAPAGPAGTGPEGGAGPLANAQPSPGPQSSFGQFLAGISSTSQYLGQQPITATPEKDPPDTTASSQIQAPSGLGYGSQMLYKGAQTASKTGTMAAMAAARGGLASNGGSVRAKTPAQHATRPGNSYANDKVPAMLSEGEVVIPREVMQAADPAAAAAMFVRQVIARRGKAG